MSEEKDKALESLYPAAQADISMPNIMMPVPSKESRKVSEVKDECGGAFKYAFLGAGQGGSRIAESFHKLGYRRVAVINTAQQDLNSIELENKLCIGEGGAGKDPEVAQRAYEERKEDVLDFMRRSFGDNVDRIFICVGAGGGTGGGCWSELIETAKEYYEVNGTENKKVGLIMALPKASEGKRVCANAFHALKKVFSKGGDLAPDFISPIMLLDNDRVSELYPNLSVSQFWGAANSTLTGLFHLFNHTASKDSSYSSFDPNDYKSVLDSGFIAMGASPVQEWEDNISIARALRENLSSNLITGGVNLKTGKCAGAVVIGGANQLDSIPQSALDQAYDQLSRMLKPGVQHMIHRGIYSSDKEELNVFTMVGGLEAPTEKMQELKVLANITQ